MIDVEEFLEVIRKVLGRDDITEETRIKDVKEWDSLKHLQIIMEIEDRFKVRIPLEKVGEISSVKDLYDITVDLL